MDRSRDVGLAASKNPDIRRHQSSEGDAVMFAEVAGRFGRASFDKIDRTATDHPADRADASRDEAAVGQLADANREISMLFLEIDHAIGQHEADIDIRISLEKLKRDRQDVEPSEHDRRGDNEYSPAAARSASSMSSRICLQAVT